MSKSSISSREESPSDEYEKIFDNLSKAGPSEGGAWSFNETALQSAKIHFLHYVKELDCLKETLGDNEEAKRNLALVLVIAVDSQGSKERICQVYDNQIKLLCDSLNECGESEKASIEDNIKKNIVGKKLFSDLSEYCEKCEKEEDLEARRYNQTFHFLLQDVRKFCDQSKHDSLGPELNTFFKKCFDGYVRRVFEEDFLRDIVRQLRENHGLVIQPPYASSSGSSQRKTPSSENQNRSPATSGNKSPAHSNREGTTPPNLELERLGNAATSGKRIPSPDPTSPSGSEASTEHQQDGRYGS